MLTDGGNVLDDPDRFGVGVLSRVISVEAVDVGHEEEIVGVNNIGGDGTQGIVVSKPDFL